MTDTGKLQGRRAIVTGAASGIGRAAAIRFAQEGATVVCVDLDKEGLSRTVEQIARAGSTGQSAPADVADETAMASIINDCLREHGGLEVMFANAGVAGQLHSILDTPLSELKAVLEVNLIGAFIAIQQSARVMSKAGSGSIVVTASVAGFRSGAGPSAYSASKAGVISLIQTAANQLAGTGVRVNALCPGLVETGITRPLFQAARAAGKESRIGQLNPTRRAGKPEEIAAAALFLASDESSYINGQALAVDGGLSSTHPFVPGKLF